jgi:hypothetical protein
MAIQFEAFKTALSAQSGKQVGFVLPNGQRVPAHFHITDVGSVHRHFIDCGGQVREEYFVQIQLWLGADKAHRLSCDTAAKILQQSQVVLNKLPELARREVMVEYQTEVAGLYAIGEIRVTDKEVVFELQAAKTQCLAALRHEQDKQDGAASACCGQSSCCG